MERGSFQMHRCSAPQIQAVEARSRHGFARHTHESYGIGLMVEGAQRSWSGRGPVESARGDIITVNPGEVHDGAPIDGARAWKMLYVAPEAIAAIVADMTDERTSDFEFTSPVLAGGRRAEIFPMAYRALTGEPRDADHGMECLTLLLAGLLQDKPPTANKAEGGIERARTMIDDDPSAPLTLADLAHAAGISRFQMVRGFARLTGLTPHAYIVQRRVDAARRQIAKGAPIADAAAACGFADQSHLTHAFVGRYGVSPGAYAQAVR